MLVCSQNTYFCLFTCIFVYWVLTYITYHREITLSVRFFKYKEEPKKCYLVFSATSGVFKITPDGKCAKSFSASGLSAYDRYDTQYTCIISIVQMDRWNKIWFGWLNWEKYNQQTSKPILGCITGFELMGKCICATHV